MLKFLYCLKATPLICEAFLFNLHDPIYSLLHIQFNFYFL